MSAKPQPALIDFQHVTVLRGGRPVLRDLTLHIPLGQHVAIFGPNGSGKSTLIKTITRECYPAARPDTVFRVFGLDAWNVFELRSILGIVTHDWAGRLDPDLTGREAVATGRYSSMRLWPDETIAPELGRRIDRILALLDVRHLADRPISDMSSGEARRILIGRALINNPKALILDEPTNSLDWRTMAEFKAALRRIAARGKSIIVVTHHPDDLIPEIRRTILLKDGRLFQDGPTDRVLTRRHLNALFGMAAPPSR
ncbi:MAG TPA: ATP-binding cassette domain-containing protein [Elusimicrobiota bacterium]|nr:ATP-binding cassette domain-containing protein [Elusimicrobiota bacterium]